MPVISVRIPQLGEGLQEALLVEFLKQPGDVVKRDEPIYVMETDKATTDVESPYDGKLVEWTVETGTVLQIGAEIGKMEVAEGVKEMAAGHGPPVADEPAKVEPAPAKASEAKVGTAVRRAKVAIPPRTRKYLKEKGLMDVADQIPADGSKLMPADIDRYIAAQSGAESGEAFDKVDLPQSQIVLNYRLSRGTQVCVPVTVMNEIEWGVLESTRATVKEQGGPTAFGMSCWAIVQAMKKHDKFRSAMAADGKSLKVFKRINLGVAVALPGDLMVTAVIRGADTMDQATFFKAFVEQVVTARDGNDQADESTTMTVSNIGKAGMRCGIPAIVAPAMATLAIGETYSHPVPKDNSFEFRRMVIATMSFDHRIANGVGAANFLNDVRQEIESFEYSGN
ncbi:MAG: 2-oxo acid dehydrogenase subunit E2 [Pirellulaceae bacterium]|nr:2-oxo acid dehydrogenase subunit E2 [Pirellulaceae bacterium]